LISSIYHLNGILPQNWFMKKNLCLLSILMLSTISLFAQIPSYVPTNGLVAWYPFNGNANDESGNGNHGIANGGVAITTDRFGISNSAYTFPGNNSSFININQNSSFSNFTSGITLSFWYLSYANQSSPGYHPRVLELGYTGTTGFGARGFPETGISVHQNSFSAGYWWTGGTGTQSLNTWYHLVISVNFISNSWIAYHNGNQILSGVNGGSTTSINYSGYTFNIGRKPITQDGAWNGKVDDIAIYNRALTAQEITALYTGVAPCQSTSSTTNLTVPSTSLPYTWNGLTFNNAGTQTATLTNAAGCDSSATLNLAVTNTLPNYLPTNGLVGYWPFNGNANDESGNENHGTVNGATLAPDRFGNSGKAYGFDGNDNIVVLNNNSLNNTSFTISAWVKLPNFNNPFYEILTKGCDLDENYELLIYGSQIDAGAVETAIKFSNGSRSGTGGSGIPNNCPNKVISDQWQFISATYDVSSGYLRTYINGVPNCIDLLSRTPKTNTTNLIFGSDPCLGRFHIGNIDDIAIYNRALTPQEITAMYSGCTSTDSSSFSASSCNQYALPWGNTVAQSGTYVHTYTNNAGCDSIVTAQITINTASDSTQGTTITATGSYTLPSGVVATESGYYSHTYSNQYGCDSTVTFYVVINQYNDSTQSNHVGINVNQPQRSLHVRDVIRLEPRNTPPANPTKGDLYFDGNRDVLRYYNGRRWVDIE
jgi:hypothetical protein